MPFTTCEVRCLLSSFPIFLMQQTAHPRLDDAYASVKQASRGSGGTPPRMRDNNHCRQDVATSPRYS
eukprot:309778-Pleurochrysis_carterae.AAC.5